MTTAAAEFPLRKWTRRPFFFAGVVVLTLAIGVALRVPHLDLRPMHGDEANQAVKTGHLYDTGKYAYDPLEHHGPTLYYLAALSAFLTGHDRFADTTEFTYRIVPVFFGLALLLLPWGLRRELGNGGAIAASLLLAVSPSFAFYSRYFIQEMLFVFFTAAVIVCAARYLRSPSLWWAIAVGVCAGLMHATKETCVIAFACMGVAGICVCWSRRTGVRSVTLVRLRHLMAASGVALAVSIAFFSSFFTHAQGPLDSLLTYANYIQRADGAGMHDKPWYHYLQTMIFTQRGLGSWWSEGLILALALAGCALAWRDRQAIIPRFLAVYMVSTTAIYSMIPYKTPWTALSMKWAMALLAGWAAAELLNGSARPWLRATMATALAAGCLHLGAQAYRANFEKFADPVNPYVYGHTSVAFMRLVERANDLAAVHPDETRMEIAVIQPDHDYWPLPWYLRSFTRVGYWDAIPEGLSASLIVASPTLHDDLAEILSERYTHEMHGLRPGVLRSAYIEKGLWDAFMDGRR